VTVAFCAVLALLVVAVAALALIAHPSQLRRRLRSRLLVTLKSGTTFDGVLFAADRRVWVLRNAQALGAGDNGSTVPVDGEVLIFTADVEYVQKP
jgi:hypothetical protein